MNEDVLREFLVSLGFQVDETSFKKFNQSIEKVTKSVERAGLVVAATAGGFVAGVSVIASQMEKLYYASQRTGATVGNLMALRYAAGQIGLTAEQAQGALEGFARTLRLNPGTNNLLQSLGVTGKDPTEKFDSFIGKMKGMQPYVAAAYAQLFGIDPDTLLMLEQGQDKRLEDEQKYREKLGAFNIDPDQAGKVGRDWNNALRDVKTDFELLWVVIEAKLLPVLEPLVDRFEKWSETHAGEVAQDIADGVEKLANWIQNIDWDQTKKDFDDIVAGVQSIIHALIELGSTKFSIGGNQDDWIELKNILSTIVNTAHALSAVLHGDFKGADSFAEKALNGLNAVIDREVGVHRVNGEPVSNDTPDMSDFGSIIEVPAAGGNGQSSDNSDDGKQPFGTIVQLPPKDNGDQSFGSIIELPSGNSSGSRRPRGIRNNNPGNIQSGSFANQHGAIGSDGDFATFASMQDGIRAATALLHSYAARGYDTIRSIISRWAPGSANNTAAYIADVTKRLGLSADQYLSGAQLDSVAPAIFGHENGHAYGNISSLMQMSQNARLGTDGAMATRSVTINQKTDINLTGSADHSGTARAVASEQSRVNGDLVRNFAGAVA